MSKTCGDCAHFYNYYSGTCTQHDQSCLTNLYTSSPACGYFRTKLTPCQDQNKTTAMVIAKIAALCLSDKDNVLDEIFSICKTCVSDKVIKEEYIKIISADVEKKLKEVEK